MSRSFFNHRFNIYGLIIYLQLVSYSLEYGNTQKIFKVEKSKIPKRKKIIIGEWGHRIEQSMNPHTKWEADDSVTEIVSGLSSRKPTFDSSDLDCPTSPSKNVHHNMTNNSYDHLLITTLSYNNVKLDAQYISLSTDYINSLTLSMFAHTPKDNSNLVHEIANNKNIYGASNLCYKTLSSVSSFYSGDDSKKHTNIKEFVVYYINKFYSNESLKIYKFLKSNNNYIKHILKVTKELIINYETERNTIHPVSIMLATKKIS